MKDELSSCQRKLDKSKYEKMELDFSLKKAKQEIAEIQIWKEKVKDEIKSENCNFITNSGDGHHDHKLDILSFDFENNTNADDVAKLFDLKKEDPIDDEIYKQFTQWKILDTETTKLSISKDENPEQRSYKRDTFVKKKTEVEKKEEKDGPKIKLEALDFKEDELLMVRKIGSKMTSFFFHNFF